MYLFQVVIGTVDLNFGNTFAFNTSMATGFFLDQTVIISEAIIVVLSPLHCVGETINICLKIIFAYCF